MSKRLIVDAESNTNVGLPPNACSLTIRPGVVQIFDEEGAEIMALRVVSEKLNDSRHVHIHVPPGYVLTSIGDRMVVRPASNYECPPQPSNAVSVGKGADGGEGRAPQQQPHA